MILGVGVGPQEGSHDTGGGVEPQEGSHDTGGEMEPQEGSHDTRPQGYISITKKTMEVIHNWIIMVSTFPHCINPLSLTHIHTHNIEVLV